MSPRASDSVESGKLETASLETLDWPLLLKALEARVGSTPGREKIRHFQLASTVDEARRRQQETTELRALLDDGIAVPVGGVRDIRRHVEAATKGQILVPGELGDVADTLEACQRVKETLSSHAGTCPTVLATASRLHDLQDLCQLLRRSFTASGELSGETYPTLADLRTRIHASHQRIKDRLAALLASEDLAPLAQDRYATIRNDRYVVPLKVQARAMDIGIVHDTSGSGRTVFVEPKQVVSLNNELKMAEATLRRTERKILAELTGRVATEGARILENVDLFARIEVMVARARLSQDLDASPPRISDRPLMRLKQVRHPVLVLRGVRVVPNDLEIGVEHQAILLSGPNTGGKTVALKTMGLAALMTRAGLHLPAEAGSEVGFFGRVLTDIGDRQTVEEDLSTFSAHMLTLKGILDCLDAGGEDTLVLIDEISVGTDPGQGAVLARALLEALVDTGARVVATTHYPELKALAVRDARFMNARVVYDPVRLRPTFQVEMGLPGRSYAFDIAGRLGLPARVVQRARGWLERGERALEDLLGELERSLARVRAERVELSRARKALEARKRDYEARLARLEEEREQVQREALKEFEEEIKQAREQLRAVVRDLQRGGDRPAQRVARARARVEGLARKVQSLAPAPRGRRETPIPRSKLRVGMKVWIAGAGKQGTIVALPAHDGGMVETMVGGLRIKTWPDDLFRHPPAGRAQPTPPPPRTARARAATPERPRLSPPPTSEELAHAMQTSANALDLRGLRADEALEEIDRFLDRAALQGDTIVFIIHGHGTGALKKATRAHLAQSPYVARFQPGEKHQGGDGVTVVGLR